MTLSRLLWLAFLGFVTLSLSLVGAVAEPPPEVVRIVRDWLADPTTKAPGIAVVGVNRSGIVWSGTFGLADVEKQRPVTRATRWQFASVTKMYTTLMLAQLTVEKRIDLDAPLTRTIPEFQPRYSEDHLRPITLRHLATHSAGILNGWGSSTHFYTSEQLLAWTRDAGLRVQPGYQFKYSNPGFAVVGIALERATGQPYSVLLQERVFERLQLNSSGLTTAPPHPDLATSYSIKNGALMAQAPSGVFQAQTPASGLVATAEDVARFAHAHIARGPSSVISQAVRDILFTPYFPLDADRGLGLGWFYSTRDNLPYWSHVGAWNSFFSRIVVRPDVGIALAFSTNGPWTRDLIVPLLKELAQDADPSDLDAWTGAYVDPAGKAFNVRRLPGPQLILAIENVGRLLPMTRQTFRLTRDDGKTGEWVRFITEDGKRVMLWETVRLVRRGS